MKNSGVLPPWLLLDPLLHGWLVEDIGRGDRSTNSLLLEDATLASALLIAKAPGIIAGLPVAARVLVNLTRLSPTPLVFKTVLVTFTTH